ncbi:MAG TPA: phosphatase PAP2 family protein [Candidatus Cloacimonetes bacterium]|nr:phosphatase PAP2 family protein [Candidatus Cloacimonadota bacterium]HEX37242.1 phosphatase PAP2 family protein [Candidatus Cloacimonadota bacterium]
MLAFIAHVDRTLFLFLNKSIANSVFDVVFPFITEPRNWLVIIALAIIFLLIKEKKQALIVLGLVIIAVALSDLIAYRIIKPLVGRMRPCHPQFFIEGGRFLGGYKTSFSFPSNHSMNIFTAATVFSYFYRKYSPYFFGFAILIGFSRIYVGVHYPLDVFGGAMFGIILGSGVYWSYTGIIISIKKTKVPNSDEAKQKTNS